MPAREKVSAQDITNALLKWRGQITAAAEELGLSRNGLMQRIKLARIDLAGYRSIGKVGTTVTTITPFAGTPSFAGGANLRPKNEGAHFQTASRVSKITPVSSALAEAPTPTRKSPRVTPQHLDKLTEAKWHLQVLLRRDLTEGQILEMCLDDCLSEWLARKIASLGQVAEQPTPADRPGRRKDKR